MALNFSLMENRLLDFLNNRIASKDYTLLYRHCLGECCRRFGTIRDVDLISETVLYRACTAFRRQAPFLLRTKANAQASPFLSSYFQQTVESKITDFYRNKPDCRLLERIKVILEGNPSLFTKVSGRPGEINWDIENWTLNGTSGIKQTRFQDLDKKKIGALAVGVPSPPELGITLLEKRADARKETKLLNKNDLQKYVQTILAAATEPLKAREIKEVLCLKTGVETFMFPVVLKNQTEGNTEASKEEFENLPANPCDCESLETEAAWFINNFNKNIETARSNGSKVAVKRLSFLKFMIYLISENPSLSDVSITRIAAEMPSVPGYSDSSLPGMKKELGKILDRELSHPFGAYREYFVRLLEPEFGGLMEDRTDGPAEQGKP